MNTQLILFIMFSLLLIIIIGPIAYSFIKQIEDENNPILNKILAKHYYLPKPENKSKFVLQDKSIFYIEQLTDKLIIGKYKSKYSNSYTHIYDLKQFNNLMFNNPIKAKDVKDKIKNYVI